jgi:hypothetical protein
MSITSRFAVGFAQYVTLEQGVNGSVTRSKFARRSPASEPPSPGIWSSPCRTMPDA